MLWWCKYCNSHSKLQIRSNWKTHLLCVPNLTTNLISVSQLVQNGNKAEFKKSCCYVYNQKNELVAVVNQINGVYFDYEKPQRLFTYTSCEGWHRRWHRRMGYLSINDLNKIKNGAVTGISITAEDIQTLLWLWRL